MLLSLKNTLLLFVPQAPTHPSVWQWRTGYLGPPKSCFATVECLVNAIPTAPFRPLWTAKPTHPALLNHMSLSKST